MHSHYLDWKDAVKKINVHMRIANKHFKGEHYYQANESYNEAKAVFELARTPDKNVLVEILYKQAICEIKLYNDMEKARSYLDQALAIYDTLSKVDKSDKVYYASSSTVYHSHTAIIKSPGINKTEASKHYYKIGKICSAYLDDEKLAAICFNKALALLNYENPETTRPFSRNLIGNVAINKIEFARTLWLVKNNKKEQALACLRNGLKVLKLIGEMGETCGDSDGPKYHQLYNKLLNLFKQIATQSELRDISAFQTPPSFFYSPSQPVSVNQEDLKKEEPLIPPSVTDSVNQSCDDEEDNAYSTRICRLS